MPVRRSVTRRLDGGGQRAYPVNVPGNISTTQLFQKAANGKDADLGRAPSHASERVSPLLHAETARPTPTEKVKES
jgi:hypothetical protein